MLFFYLANTIFPVGFINKGNTCYANSILQVLSVMYTLWNRVPSESNHLSPTLWAISLNMAVKKNSNKPIEPSKFLWALKCILSSTRVTSFGFNSQQDVAEILQVVLDELKRFIIISKQLNFLYTKNNSVLQHLPMFLCFRGKPWYTDPTSINWHTNFSQTVRNPWDFIIRK